MTAPGGRDFDFDVVVIGSGFGGSVTALRLTEKGYRVAVLEAGRRFTDDTLPKTSWDLRKFLWAPQLGMTGMQRISMLRDVVVLSGAGVGGGSLIYANTLYEPLAPFYDDEQWRGITDWRDELAPHYVQAKRMLGVVTTPFETAADVAMKAVAADMGVGETYHPTPVGVFFGEPGKTVPDPFFGGEGPDRTGCIQCGNCMIGCRFGAKNRLDKTYLYLAEHHGCEVHPLTTVTAVRPLADDGYAVETRPTAGRRRAKGRTFTAEHVVFSAGALGTQRLLFEMRDKCMLSRISSRLGALTRTNSEALLGAMVGDRKVDYSKGIAITSSFHPDEHTHIEPVRYGKGSNAMGLLATVMTDGGGRLPRWLKFLGVVLRHPLIFLRSLSVWHWSERTIIVLVMQSLDNSLTVFRKRGLFGSKLSSRPGHGEPNPTWIPVGNEATRRLAEKIGGYPGGSLPEIINVPMTAHILGGACIGDTAETGVIDPYQRVYGHPGLHVVDGSAISANLGVNPSLTITAQAERAMSLWPNKGEEDKRSPLGSAYARVDPVPPNGPIVRAGAPAHLWYANGAVPTQVSAVKPVAVNAPERG